jgi:hypothetical protein
MDTNLGFIGLTDKQVSRLSGLRSEVINGFTYQHDLKMVTIVSARDLTDQEISDLKISIVNLPDEYSQDYYKDIFDVIRFQTDLAGLLPTLSDSKLRWEFAALNTYATNLDFPGLAWYINLLYAGGAATLADIEAVIALLKKQNVTLDDF